MFVAFRSVTDIEAIFEGKRGRKKKPVSERVFISLGDEILLS